MQVCLYDPTYFAGAIENKYLTPSILSTSVAELSAKIKNKLAIFSLGYNQSESRVLNNFQAELEKYKNSQIIPDAQIIVDLDQQLSGAEEKDMGGIPMYNQSTDIQSNATQKRSGLHSVVSNSIDAITSFFSKESKEKPSVLDQSGELFSIINKKENIFVSAYNACVRQSQNISNNLFRVFAGSKSN